MPSRSLKYSSPLAVLAIALTVPFLPGCAAPGLLLAAQLIPTAFVAYQFLPGGTSAELTNPGEGALSPEIAEASSMKVLTDNMYVEEYMSDVFKVVTPAKKSPNSNASAASMAKKAGYDAFVRVDTSGASVKGGFVAKIIYGTATVQVVSANGKVLYNQTASLTSKANSQKNLSPRQVAEALAQVLVDDLKKSIAAASKEAPVSTAAASKETSASTAAEKQQGPSLGERFKRLFN